MDPLQRVIAANNHVKNAIAHIHKQNDGMALAELESAQSQLTALEDEGRAFATKHEIKSDTQPTEQQQFGGISAAEVGHGG